MVETNRSAVRIPPAKVDVADEVFVIDPAVMFNPPDEERDATERPVNVEVAAEVTKRDPPVTVRPFELANPAAWIPPVNVVVAAPITRKLVVANDVVVASVPVAFVNVKSLRVEEEVTKRFWS